MQRTPAAAAKPAVAGGAAPGAAEITPPRPGINQTGFIDTSDGAFIRTGPAEAGGKKLLDLPLPPATRVFVSGTHPGASQWWYVSASLPGHTMVRGYVQHFRVNTDLPEPLAELRQLVGKERPEDLAREKFGHAVTDGHDLRYYENVLLYVNQQRHRVGIQGSYQNPNVLGSGSNNIQLFSGHRIWLVSAEYAKALQRVVPSGSLTGGAVAKVKRFAGHLQDILQSVTESWHHLDSVAGEAAQSIRDHIAEIIGITAGFLVAEAASMFLAATPTGVGQAAAVVIQLALSAFGAAGMVQASAEALKHGTAWLTIAWTAQGDGKKITEASKEFLRMLVAIAMAALGYLGARGNYRKALAIANHIPTGGLPALATAGAATGARGAAGAGAAVSTGPGLGAIGAAGAQMAKHDDEHPGSEPHEPVRTDERPARGGSDGAGKRAPKETQGTEKPRRDAGKPGPHGGEVAEASGRGLPECPVAKSAMEPEVIDTDPRALEYALRGKTLHGTRVDFGSVELELTPQGDPAAPPSMSLSASAYVDGIEYAARIYEEVVAGPGGKPVGRGARIPLTRYALDSFGRFYQRRFGYPLKVWGGSLAFENKLNFQREYARLTGAGILHEEAILEAAKKISFGRHRIDAGFSRLAVKTNPPREVDLGPGFGIRKVPTEIKITAEKP